MEKKTISHRVLSEFFAPNQISQAKQGPYCNTRIDILSKTFLNALKYQNPNVWFAMFDLVSLVWYVCFCRFDLVGLVCYDWFCLFSLV